MPSCPNTVPPKRISEVSRQVSSLESAVAADATTAQANILCVGTRRVYL